MSNLYRGPSIDASYQVSVHFGHAVSKEKIFKISGNPKQEWPVARGPSIHASYYVSVHLAMRFQRRRFLKISQLETRMACGGHVC
jgi:hypothetical protein